MCFTAQSIALTCIETSRYRAREQAGKRTDGLAPAPPSPVPRHPPGPPTAAAAAAAEEERKGELPQAAGPRDDQT